MPTVTKADFKMVKRKVLEVLEANMIVRPPVIAAELAIAAGLEVRCTLFKPDYAEIAGFIDTDKMAIVVNAVESPVRQNFTIAHELGHYLLKHHESSEYTVLLRDTRAMIKTPMEQEANCFAANLLVPSMFLREYIANYPLVTDQQLAGLFGVSTEVIRFRRLYY
jgi:Zn-dependent peptidase ImmA (M78 family)